MLPRLALLTVCLLATVRPAAGQVVVQPPGDVARDRMVGATVTAVRVVSNNLEVQDPQVASLLEIKVGDALTPVAVRRTIVHLMGLGTYLDVRVHSEPADAGVSVIVELVPLREVGRLVFRGETGLPDRVLRDAVTLRFGTQPPLGRATDIARTLEEMYRDHGYLRASVQPRPLDAPGTEPGDLVSDVSPGARAALRNIEFRGEPDDAVARVRGVLGLRSGGPYEPSDLRRRLNAQVEAFRSEGFLAARADPFSRISDDGNQVDLTIAVTRGPLVRVSFAGDPLPVKERDNLVPVAREGSADEDLLEDSQARIERFLRGQGYRDARAPFSRSESDGRLSILFTVTRGPVYRVSGVGINADAAVPMGSPSTLIRVKPGDPFVQARLDADVAAVEDDLRRRGYTRAVVTPVITAGVRAAGSADVPVMVALQIEEGPRAVVSQVTFEGARVLADEVLLAGLTTRTGDAYYRPTVERDRGQVLTEYRNRGHREASVDAVVTRGRRPVRDSRRLPGAGRPYPGGGQHEDQ